MSEVLRGVDQEFQEASHLLQQLSQTGEQQLASFQQVLTRLKQHAATMPQVGQQFQHELSDLASTVQQSGAKIELMVDQTEQVARTTNENLKGSADKLKSRLDQVGKVAQSAVESSQAGVKTTVDDSQATLQSFAQNFQAVGASMEKTKALEQNLTNKLQAVQSQLTKCSTSVQGLNSKFEGRSQQFAASVQKAFTAVESEGKKLTSNLEGTLTPAFNNSLQAFDQTVHQDLDKFGKDVDKLAKNMSNESKKVFDGLRKQAGEQMLKETEQAIQKQVHRTAEELAVSLGKNIVTASAGATVTSAMSPILPEVIVLYDILKAVNKVL